MTTIPIPVDDTAAEAFQAAPAAEQARLSSLVSALFRATLSSSEDREAQFRRAADASGREAQARGWNDELDQALLRGDFDDDE